MLNLVIRRMLTIFVLLLAFFPPNIFQTASGSNLNYLGCYKKDSSSSLNSGDEKSQGDNGSSAPASDFLLDLWFTPQELYANDGPTRCISSCQKASFRYAGIMKSPRKVLECLCGSSYGRNGIGECDNCTMNPAEHCGSDTASSIYDTNFKVPSPPQQIMLLQRSENALRISWVKPLAPNGPLDGYRIHAQPVFSYSQGSLQPKSWEVSDASQQQQYLIGLSPGSQYNVSVQAVNSEGASASISALLWTKIGVPDVPPAPRIIRQQRRTMTIELQPTRNTKGPISAYRILLLDDSQANFFTFDNLVRWNDSVDIGYPYYVAAEFSPEDFPSQFVVGSGGTYGGYYNGPLPSGHWHPSLGIVSSMDGFVEASYSTSSHDQHSDAVVVGHREDHVNERVEIIETDSMIVNALWIAIGISGCILVVCTIVYVGLKLNLLPKKRRRRQGVSVNRAENHQLTSRDSSLMQSQNYPFPITEEHVAAYTHAGYVHDEDIKGKCLEKLQQVWYVPRNFMDIPSQEDAEEEGVQLVAKGRYGPVYMSSLRNTSTPISLFSIPSSYFKNGGDKQDGVKPELGLGVDHDKFFEELDELIRLDNHENVVKLIGFMEDDNSMLFAVEYGGVSLKSLLLQYRQSDSKPVTPYSLLLCAMNIAEGMFHLHSYQLTHGQLAACNVLITQLEVPKITGFGLLSSNPLRENLDYMRWSAVEKFQNRCVKSCDVWSFGILLWEIATLGGTPYYDIRSEDFPKRICIGTRPNQTEVMSDALYQIMLYCWQLDRDERPDFSRLSCSIHELLSHSKDNLFINHSLNYPPYIHHYEHEKM